MKWIWKGIAVLVISSVPVFSWADSDEQSTVSYTTGTRITPDATSIFGTRYSRVIRLEHDGRPNQALLATYECWPADFPFFRSEGDGHTWTQISQMPLIASGGWNMRVEPDLLELPVEMGGLPAGTILLAGNAWNDAPPEGEPNRRHDLWYSLDQGLSWHFRGTIEVQDDSRNVNIWEPQLEITADGRLACYYSEERNAPYNQILAQRISDDGGLTWGEQSLVCAIPDSTQRPGMPVVTKMGNGTYVMSFEAVGKAVNSHQVHIKFSADGIDWGDPTDYGTPVEDSNGIYPAACPTITWTPAGGPQGTLIITAAKVGGGTPDTDRKLFLNTSGGSGAWTMLPAPVQWQGGNTLSGWSQGMIPSADQQGIIQLAPSSITINGSDEYNEMRVGRQQLIVPGNDYTLRHEASRLTLEIPGGTTVLETQYSLAALTKYARQRWAFSSIGHNSWVVRNPVNGLAWDHNWEPVAGDPVFQWEYNGLLPQQWQLMPTGRGSWKFISAAGDNLALASEGDVTTLETESEGVAPDREWFPIVVNALDAVPPLQPSGLTATVGDRFVSLEWDESTESDWASYSVYRAAAGVGPYQAIASGLTVAGFIDRSVSNGASYYYIVTATDREVECFFPSPSKQTVSFSSRKTPTHLLP